MRPAVIGIIPAALLSASCTLRPWTPSVSVAFWSQDVPASRVASVPRSAEIARVWQLPADNPWARYYKGTLISSLDALGPIAPLPDVRALDVIAEAQGAASRLAEVGLPSNTLWLVDLRGAAACAFAARLSRAASAPVAPVVTFNNWPANDAVIPAEETLAGLLEFTPNLPSAGAQEVHPVVLLDSWRLAYRFDAPADGDFDNRYALMPGDLPNVKMLHEQGITRVVYLVEDIDDAEVEEDDLHGSLREWQAAGIGIHMVDLAFLRRLPGPIDWAAHLAPESHWVGTRHTLIDDPIFNARARGGFGLASGRPIYGAAGFRGSGGGSRWGGGGG